MRAAPRRYLRLAQKGITAPPVTVEVHLANRLPRQSRDVERSLPPMPTRPPWYHTPPSLAQCIAWRSANSSVAVSRPPAPQRRRITSPRQRRWWAAAHNPSPAKSLAHHGMLLLDKLPVFNQRVLDVLRGPLESGRIVISRAASHVEFLRCFQPIAATVPANIYGSRLPGPLLDHIDLHVEVQHHVLRGTESVGPHSADLADADGVATAHVGEALSYRRLDRVSIVAYAIKY